MTDLWIFPAAVLAGVIGSFAYANRGGNYLKAPNTVNRLLYAIPAVLLLSFGFLTNNVTFSPISTVGNLFDAYGITAGHAIHFFVGLVLGNGLFIDMGRWFSRIERKEYEAPVTWFIGAGKYPQTFEERWRFDMWGMSIYGLLRHSHLWWMLGELPLSVIIAYQLSGAFYSLLYEAGHRTGEEWGNPLKKPGHEHTFYSEHYVGFFDYFLIALISFTYM